MMMGENFGWGGGWMFFGGVMMLLFWGGLIALIVVAIRSMTSSNTSSRNEASDQRNDNTLSPLEVLQSRYAKGEISRDDYEVIRRDLQAAKV